MSFIATLFNIMGNVLSGLLYASPIKRIIAHRRYAGLNMMEPVQKKPSEQIAMTNNFDSTYTVNVHTPNLIKIDVNPLPYVGSLLNCLTWSIYGFVSGLALQVGLINVLGVALSIFFCVSFLSHDRDEKMKQRMEFSIYATFLFAIVLIILEIFVPIRSYTSMIGILAASCNVFYVLSGLPVLVRIIRSRNAEAIDPLLTLALVCCTMSWFIYGMLIRNWYLLIPNACGTASGMIQGIIKIVIGNCCRIAPVHDASLVQSSQSNSSDQELESKSNTHVNLSTNLSVSVLEPVLTKHISE